MMNRRGAGLPAGCCRALGALLAAFMLAAAAGRARADTAVLRPLPEQPTPEPAAALAQQVATEALAHANIHVIQAAAARERLRQAAENPCLEVDCASSVLRVLDADMLVAVTVASDGEVLVALVDARGHHVNATAPSDGRSVAAPTRAAVNRALSLWPSRELVSIKVEGTPEGATVTVDGQPRGVLPLELRLQPGRHELVFAMAGYLGKRDIVEVAAGQADATKHEVALEPDAGQAADDRRTRWGLIGGPALAVAGTVTLSVALASLARERCTQRAPGGTCVQRDEVATGPVAAWSTVGALALVGGATWFALGLRRANQARRVRPQLDVGWNYVSLRGSF